MAEQPSQPITRHNDVASAETPTRPRRARHDGTNRPGHLMGMGTAHRTASRQAPRRPAKPTADGQRDRTSTRRPSSAQVHSNSQQTSSPHSHGRPPRTPPSRLALGAKTLPRSLARKGRENFPERHRAPLGKLGRIRVSLLPLALPLSRRRHPHHKARQGGGPQHEEADSHGKEHRREVARGNPRVPEAQGRRGPGGDQFFPW